MSRQNKTLVRKKILEQRKTVSQTQFQEKSQQICDRIRNWQIFCESKTVLSYFSFRQEPDLISLVAENKEWGFPVCIGNDLLWYPWQPEDALTSGKYGIREPLNRESSISINDVDLIIVPAVACDNSGYRLGYGGGYYDRLLSLPKWKSCPTLGVVFDFAYLDVLPIEAWDIKLQYVCTESFLDKF